MPTRDSYRAGVALVIGVGSYLRTDRVEALRFATQDAVAFADTLANPNLCGFPRDQVILLTNADARRDEVVQRLSRWLPNQARGAELVVIYFAGHGMVHEVGRREEGFLLPYDADPDDVVTRGIAMSDVATWIGGLDAGVVVVCLDCCHAGKVLGQRDLTPASVARNMELRPTLLPKIAGQGRYLIASCDEGQKSYECADLGHGLFTYHLLRGIAGEADRDGDGRVGLAELFSYVSQAVSRDARQRFGRDQKPWTSATYTEETYISSPHLHTLVPESDPLERLQREEGVAAVVREIERMIPDGDDESLRQALRFLGRLKDPTGIPVIFRCLGHASEAVREEARSALHALDWDVVVGTVEGLARRSNPTAMAAVLDGLNAFEAHPRLVSLLDRLVAVLKGELRNRAILLLERKRLGLGLERVAALFAAIQSPYQIKKALGQGLFTETYLARAEDTDLEVVVRVLRPEFVSQPHVRARFLDLCHDSVPLVHERLALTREARAFPDRDIYFAVRDYIRGVTLQRVLEAGKRFEPIKVVRILREVAEALTPLHRRGMCHGAIKPSNIFLCEGGRRVVLGDPGLPVCGIGVALDRLAYDYRYAAPEAFLGGATWGPRADDYALGCVAYELLCGEPPFVSDNFHELAARHISGSILTPRERGSRLGEKGDAVILKLLARSPAERYGKLEEVLQALASLEDALKKPPGAVTVPGLPSLPLVRDASMVNYQGAQSVVRYDQTGAPLHETTDHPGASDSALESVAFGSGEAGSVASQPGTSVGPAPGPTASTPEVPGYEIQHSLGRGAMGAVYLARDVALDRVVALKVLPWVPGHSADVAERFSREARAAAKLNHPNVVQIYSWVEHEGFTCLALEYVAGGDLARKMSDARACGNPFAIREAVEMMVAMARAVESAHQHGILHRDLKPSNILLTPDGQPKIGDFGLAKLLGGSPEAAALTHEGALLGTPAYMAPEQADPSYGPVTPAVDVYALGNIFYEMLTSQRPVAGVTHRELLARITSERPTPPTRLRPEIPSALEAVCLKCLEKDPAQRYPSAAALADDLERWLRQEPVLAKARVSEQPVAAQPPETEEHAVARPPSIWQRLSRFFPSSKSGKPPRENQLPDA